MSTKKSAWIFGGAFAMMGILLVVYFIAYRYKPAKIHRTSTFTYHRDFGIAMPMSFSIHGIDVSRHQENINWPAVKKMQSDGIRIRFAFIKATEGVSLADKNFVKNWKGAFNAGITRGAYHYFLASKEGTSQARNFIKNVKLQPGDLPPVLDMEEMNGVSPATMRGRAKDWLQTVEQAYGVRPIIYANVKFFNDYLDGYFTEYPLWVAHYYERQRPAVHVDWLFWQFSSNAHVEGITRKVDFNVFAGDSIAFQKLRLK